MIWRSRLFVSSSTYVRARAFVDVRVCHQSCFVPSFSNVCSKVFRLQRNAITSVNRPRLSPGIRRAIMMDTEVPRHFWHGRAFRARISGSRDRMSLDELSLSQLCTFNARRDLRGNTKHRPQAARAPHISTKRIMFARDWPLRPA
jgi:hypothetical protein